MGRENSPHIVGPFWLDRRPDGKSDAWQIASYDAKARTVRYRSTRCREIAPARDALDAHYAAEKAAKPQTEEALVVPQLVLYWREHGRNVIRPDTIVSALRHFIGFLFQDAVGPAVTFAELKPVAFKRYKEWRMRPHAYTLEWEGRTYRHKSTGVVGESVQRDLNTVRAALNHSVDQGRVPYAPKVRGVPDEERSPPRKRVLTVAELGAMLGFAAGDKTLRRFIVAQIATAARPEAVLAWRPELQADFAHRLFDEHPPEHPRTKKRNPVVPIPVFWLPMLEEWIADGFTFPDSVRKRWTTMRRALRLGDDVYAKTIRHTVATVMRRAGVPWADIQGQLGHRMPSTSDDYAKYAPDYLSAATTAIEALWEQALSAEAEWLADHLRTKVGNGPTTILTKEAVNA